MGDGEDGGETFIKNSIYKKNDIHISRTLIYKASNI